MTKLYVLKAPFGKVKLLPMKLVMKDDKKRGNFHFCINSLVCKFLHIYSMQKCSKNYFSYYVNLARNIPRCAIPRGNNNYHYNLYNLE